MATKLDKRAWDDFTAAIAAGRGELRGVFKQWGRIYLSFVQRRFNAFSRGGGNWPKLTEETVKRKRGKASPSRRRRARRVSAAAGSVAAPTAMLVATGTLKSALDIGSPGNVFKLLVDGARVGFAQTRHPAGGVSILGLAVIHDLGLGRVPQREILVEPDTDTQRQLNRSLSLGLDKLGKRSERR